MIVHDYSLGDDWAYANETRTKSWHFRNMEADLKTAVERFNARRYGKMYPAFKLGELKEGTSDTGNTGAGGAKRLPSAAQASRSD